MIHSRVTPRVALLACSIFVFLLESQAPNAAASQEVVTGDSGEGGGLRLSRAKRQLIGTPSIPLVDPKRKRPFCNAFTGCGKKRSDGPARVAPAGNGGIPELDLGEDSADESMATLVELNSEPAVAELSRQILSEAKLWEAIQEASQELARRRQQQAMFERKQNQRMVERHPRGRQPSEYELEAIRKRREAPPPIPKGTLPSAGNGALPIV